MTAIAKHSNKIRQTRTASEWILDIFKVVFLAVVTIVTVGFLLGNLCVLCHRVRAAAGAGISVLARPYVPSERI